jgi:hypothetical protein
MLALFCLSACLILWAGRDSCAAPEPVASPKSSQPVGTAERSIVVRPTADRGPLPPLYRPSVNWGWSTPEAQEAFLAIPGRFGALRLAGLELLLRGAPDQKTYMEGLRSGVQALRRLRDRGGELIVSFSRTPRWLASRSERGRAREGWSVREASPPKDYGAVEDLAYATVRLLNRESGLSPLYEFWNEPDLGLYWLGTREELFRYYAAFVTGARRADPKARVGGPAVSRSGFRTEGKRSDTPLLEAFLRFAGSHRSGSGDRLPLDFVTWHHYDKSPEGPFARRAGKIRRWLSAAGYPADTPQILDEWGVWATTSHAEPARDDEVGAAFIPAALNAMEQAGIDLQTYFSLQDMAPDENLFVGGFGLLTHTPMVKKATFHVTEMLGRLSERRVEADVPVDLMDLEGVGALSTGGPNRVVVLLYRFGEDPRGALMRILRRAGVLDLDREDLPISNELMRAFLRGEVELKPGEVSPAAMKALQEVRRALSAARRDSAGPPRKRIELTLQIEGWPSTLRYSIYLVDRDHLNPSVAYHAARGRGATQAEALRAARGQERFEPWAEGTGPLPAVPLDTHAVALVIAQPG